MAFYDDLIEQELKNWDYQPNILQFYDNVTYNMRFYMIPNEVHEFIQKENKKGNQKIYIPDNYKVIIFETGVTANYSMTSFSMKNAFGVIGSNNSINVNMNMNLEEVNGCSLFNKIAAIGKLIGYESPIQQPYYLDIWFTGYEPPKNVPVNKIGGVITYSTLITNCKSSVTDSGAKYNINMVGTSMGVVSKDISLLNGIAPIKATSVEDFRKNLEEQVNTQYFKLHPELQQYYEKNFVDIKLYAAESFETDIQAQKLNITNNSYDSWISEVKTGTKNVNGTLYANENGKYVPIGSAIPKKDSQTSFTPLLNFTTCIFDRVGENIDTNNKGEIVYKPQPNSILENVFQEVCFLSPQLRDRIALVIYSATPIKNKEGRELYKLTMNVFFKKNHWLHWYIESNKKYAFDKVKDKGVDNSLKSLYENDIRKMQLQALEDMKRTNGLCKKYQYLFNGQDTNVLELQTDIDKLWYMNSAQTYLLDTAVNTSIISEKNKNALQNLIDLKILDQENKTRQDAFNKALSQQEDYNNLQFVRLMASDKRLYMDDIYYCLNDKDKRDLLGTRTIVSTSDTFGQASSTSKTDSIDYNCARAGFSNLFHSGNLVKIKIKILGDPYWLGLFAENKIQGSEVDLYNVSTEKFFVFDMKTAVTPDANEKGIYDLENTVDITGIFRVIYITSYFENGKFTQVIEASIHPSFMHSNYIKV